jgi:hypothetical protein
MMTHVTAPAELIYRGKMCVHAALTLFLYACTMLGVQKESFVVQLGLANMWSIGLFASLGFRIVGIASISDPFEGVSWAGGKVCEYSWPTRVHHLDTV